MAAEAIAAPPAGEPSSIFAAAPGAPQTPVEPADPSDTFLEMAHRSDRLTLALVGRLGAPPQVRLTLPAETAPDGRGVAWATLWQQLMHRLHVGDRHWPPATTVALVAGDRDLEPRQLAAIAEVLQEVQLTLSDILTSRPALARLAIDQGYRVTYRPSVSPAEPNGDPNPDASLTDPSLDPDDILTINNTIRSGVEIRYPGTVVIVGDVNPGGSVVAVGDIIIWGRLRGVAHAGSQGNSQATIAALQLEATQLRIASRAARVPPAAGDLINPEIAYICDRGIRISPLRDYPRSRSTSTPR
ncbi:MAG: hypothetical protein Fur0042_29140 [Cyanophyceae cyanobacterium]